MMALDAQDLIEVSLNILHMSQQMNMVFQYEIDTIPPSVSTVQLAEGWWNHVKASTRALAQASFGAVFRTVRIRELNDAGGDYAEFDIPIGEQAGTRAVAASERMPPFVATGVRLVVGSRITRPGQKRVPFLLESDVSDGVVTANMLALITTWCGVMTNFMTLGAPAATVGLIPMVMRKDASGFVTARQQITGFLINPNATTQNSRKFGRGI